jgi:hypothetical protein
VEKLGVDDSEMKAYAVTMTSADTVVDRSPAIR